MSALLDIGHLNAWHGASQVLFGVDLHVNEGEIVALAGRNASGRSTLAKAIVGLVRTSGTICFAGRALTGLSTFEIARRGIGYVAEERDVFPTLSVEENLQLGVMTGRQRGRGFNAASAFARFPVLAPRRFVKAAALSGGERQMLVLARALMGEPRLLIVDEPAEGLAPQAVECVRTCLRQSSAQGTAILLIEQRMQLARDLAARVAVLGGGRIVCEGRFDQLDRSIVDAWLTPG
jgi:branched-chain amino acid transport system ATP-binding protein